MKTFGDGPDEYAAYVRSIAEDLVDDAEAAGETIDLEWDISEDESQNVASEVVGGFCNVGSSIVPLFNAEPWHKTRANPYDVLLHSQLSYTKECFDDPRQAAVRAMAYDIQLHIDAVLRDRLSD